MIDKDWRARLVDEFREVNERIDKLETIVYTINNPSITRKQYYLMKGQLDAMRTYSWFLAARLDDADETTPE